MDNHDIVGRIMDKAQAADRRALFASLQAALMTITDLYYAVDWPHGPGLSVILQRVEQAIDLGAEYGSPEHLAAIQAKRDRSR